jgi:replication factor C small subunit
MVSDLWTDIFEPQTLDQIIGQVKLVTAFKQYVKDGHIPNMTIAGAPGCGKTLLMKCFAADMGFIKYVDGKLIELIPGQFYLLDASKDRGIDVVRGTIKRLSQKPTINGMPRLIVLDEFNFTADAQAAMRSLMQECSDNVRFINLSNDPSNIIEPIISRCPLKMAEPLTLEDMKILITRIQKVKDFKVSPEAIEYLYKMTIGDIRSFIGQLQEACIISNYDVQLKHVQNVSIDIQTAKSILEVAQVNYDQAKEVMITIFMKTRNAKDLLEKLYMATYLVKFSEIPFENEVIQRRLRERIAEADFRLSPSQGTNPIIQLDALINYIKLIKFIPLQCPKAK